MALSNSLLLFRFPLLVFTCAYCEEIDRTSAEKRYSEKERRLNGNKNDEKSSPLEEEDRRFERRIPRRVLKTDRYLTPKKQKKGANSEQKTVHQSIVRRRVRKTGEVGEM